MILLSLDDDINESYRDPGKLSAYVREHATDSSQKYYVLIDEIQYAISKEEMTEKDAPVRLYGVLDGFLHMKNVDVYVTGSNSKMLSKDISTEFRGRGDAVRVYPLSFAEYYSAANLDKTDAYNEYSMYGGMPYLFKLNTDEDKFQYLSDLFEEIFFKFDIVLDGGEYEAKWNLSCKEVGAKYSWLNDPDSVNEVGCIHTCQGLDMNYCGVIIGKDLQYRDGRLVFCKEYNAKTDRNSGIRNADDEEAMKLIRNTYYVLLTRGMMGTYVYCEDPGLREYLKSFLREQ